MIQRFYVFAWLLLAGSVVLTAIDGPMNGPQMITFGFVGLALVYALALWAIVANTREAQPG